MNNNSFKLIFRKLRVAGLPITREMIELARNEIKERTNKAFDFLNEIHSEIFPPSVPIYEDNENWSVSKKAPMVPLGAGNPAFPAGYFDSFTGKLSNGEVEVE